MLNTGFREDCEKTDIVVYHCLDVAEGKWIVSPDGELLSNERILGAFFPRAGFCGKFVLAQFTA